MKYKAAYHEIMRSYEASRNQAQTLLQERRDALYKNTPRIADIDNELSFIGLSLAKTALSNDQDGLKAAQAKAEALKYEKNNLMINLGLAENYLTAIYNCTVCSDTGYISSSPGQPAKRCNCLSQRLIEAYYELSNIKNVLKKENFDTFDYRFFSPGIIEAEGISPQKNMEHIYRLTTQFVQNFGKEDKNLLLFGRAGLGKTFICHCIAKDILDEGYTVLYLTAPRLFKVVEDLRFNRSSLEEPDDMMDAVTDVDLLILDDLGAELVTSVTSSALFDIVNQRLLSGKPTVISTNLSPTELAAQYSDRIFSRFAGRYQMVKFIGEDIRIKSKYGGLHDNPAKK